MQTTNTHVAATGATHHGIAIVGLALSAHQLMIIRSFLTFNLPLRASRRHGARRRRDATDESERPSTPQQQVRAGMYWV
jgi:hypothetical protein